jgi:hypothetical protein
MRKAGIITESARDQWGQSKLKWYVGRSALGEMSVPLQFTLTPLVVGPQSSQMRLAMRPVVPSRR